MEKCLIATMRWPGTNSATWSTKRKGKRWGRILAISVVEKCAMGDLKNGVKGKV
jgi:hypothetical protein